MKTRPQATLLCVDHTPADYLALSSTLTDILQSEVARFAADPKARLNRALFSDAMLGAGFVPHDFPLLDDKSSDIAFIDSLESLVQTLVDVSQLMETFGGSQDSLIEAMTDFFDHARLPEDLPRPTPRP